MLYPVSWVWHNYYPHAGRVGSMLHTLPLPPVLGRGPVTSTPEQAPAPCSPDAARTPVLRFLVPSGATTCGLRTVPNTRTLQRKFLADAVFEPIALGALGGYAKARGRETHPVVDQCCLPPTAQTLPRTRRPPEGTRIRIKDLPADNAHVAGPLRVRTHRPPRPATTPAARRIPPAQVEGLDHRTSRSALEGI